MVFHYLIIISCSQYYHELIPLYGQHPSHHYTMDLPPPSRDSETRSGWIVNQLQPLYLYPIIYTTASWTSSHRHHWTWSFEPSVVWEQTRVRRRGFVSWAMDGSRGELNVCLSQTWQHVSIFINVHNWNSISSPIQYSNNALLLFYVAQ